MAVLDDTRRDRVLLAVAAAFARYGYRRTSMDLLAQAADMSRPALYQYFDNKETVFREMTGWVLDRNAAQAQAEAASAPTPGAAIEAILGRVLDLHNPAEQADHFYELIDDVEVRAGDLWADYQKRIHEMIRARLADHGVDAQEATAVLFYGAKGIGLDPGGDEQRRRHLTFFVTAFLRGLSTD